jgi:hypothetical protein
VAQTVSELDKKYPLLQEKIEHVSTASTSTQQSDVSHDPAQVGAIAQSDRRNMPAATHKPDENATPDPSASTHVRSGTQVQSSASHPTVAQTVSGLDTKYPVLQKKVEHVSMLLRSQETRVSESWLEA